MDIDFLIGHLVEYGIKKQLINDEERVYTVNLLLDLFNKDSFKIEKSLTETYDLEFILSKMLDYAVENCLIKEDTITNRDLFDTKIMGCLTPRPSQVISQFNEKYNISPEEATKYFYSFSQDNNYIRKDRIKNDIKWKINSKYGEIDITINLSKPEKDPKEIATAKKLKQTGYPKCQLCYENEGFSGNLNSPARQNHRVIPININDTSWGFQYSPYVYYNEHCIAFNKEHIPMKIDKDAFVKLIDFLKIFPHYFIGSNADLPIVGGSILTHDHFQGGNYTFAMEKADIEKKFKLKEFEDIEAGILNWPLSVIRISSKDEKRLVNAADYILEKWSQYDDNIADIISHKNNEKHNTITPIARRKEGKFVFDLTLRNNRTTNKKPFGLFHPDEKLHHIKKENIGLIEVMGLAVLPSRLKNEIDLMSEFILEGKDFKTNEKINIHSEWFDSIKDKYQFNQENVTEILKEEIGKVFIEVLESAGVYKCNNEGREGFDRFLNTL